MVKKSFGGEKGPAIFKLNLKDGVPSPDTEYKNPVSKEKPGEVKYRQEKQEAEYEKYVEEAKPVCDKVWGLIRSMADDGYVEIQSGGLDIEIMHTPASSRRNTRGREQTHFTIQRDEETVLQGVVYGTAGKTFDYSKEGKARLMGKPGFYIIDSELDKEYKLFLRDNGGQKQWSQMMGSKSLKKYLSF